MLKELQPQPRDKIIHLIQKFREDPRTDKIDLGVGVYKDSTGTTPVMAAVKAAEHQLWQSEKTKTYTGLAGEPDFRDAMCDLVLGDAIDRERVATAATPGGTGAVRQALELVKLVNPEASIWISAPSWPNHRSIVNHLGFRAMEYVYFDYDALGVDFGGMIESLQQVRAGDAVILHGCCHNPTGANLSPTQWSQVGDLVLERNALPIVDIAYQGFGEGVEADATPLRKLAASVPELLIAASCSKNFGIYRERTGILIAVAPDAASADLSQGALTYLNRQNYSFPPDHGARLVTMILADDDLRARWKAELDVMKTGMRDIRMSLAAALRERSNSDRFDFLTSHSGMFSLLGASTEQVMAMREKYGIYMVADSRINIAGLNERAVPILAEAMIDVGL